MLNEAGAGAGATGFSFFDVEKDRLCFPGDSCCIQHLNRLEKLDS